MAVWISSADITARPFSKRERPFSHREKVSPKATDEGIPAQAISAQTDRRARAQADQYGNAGSPSPVGFADILSLRERTPSGRVGALCALIPHLAEIGHVLDEQILVLVHPGGDRAVFLDLRLAVADDYHRPVADQRV